MRSPVLPTLGAVLLAAACRTHAPPAPIAAATMHPARACDIDSVWTATAGALTLLWRSVRMADAVPEFGGAFSDTVLNVYVTNASAAPRVRELLDRFNHFGTLGKEVRFLPGKYSFRQLVAWARCFESQPVPGVVSLAIDERTNRVLVGAASDAAMHQAREAILRLQLPLDAFTIERRDYPRVGHLGTQFGRAALRTYCRWLTSA